VCAGSIIGSGVGRKLADVRWGVAGRLAIAWVITLPAAALVGGGTSWASDLIGGTTGVLVMAAVGAILALGLYIVTRRDRVTADNLFEQGSASRDPNTVKHDLPDLVAA
jgi:PiT family inorganic phosphate transporter